MRTTCLLVLAMYANSCQQSPLSANEVPAAPSLSFIPRSFKSGTWQQFLQNLPTRSGPVVDYTGLPVSNQAKHAAILTYDVGRKDLQQCADALIRLRAEYLFGQQRYDDISFHFTSGHLYTWWDYCNGMRPLVQGSKVTFIQSSHNRQAYTRQSLRAYLDIVYAYAGTRSLARELPPAKGFEVGTIIIQPGSPGHCCMIVDESVNKQGRRLFKLAEGYTPAQSIYILKNPLDGSSWYELKKGESIHTTSYRFTNYQLCRFE